MMRQAGKKRLPILWGVLRLIAKAVLLYIRLFLLKKAWRSLKRTASLENLRERIRRMSPKVKLSEAMEEEKTPLPPMPGSGSPESGPSSPSTGGGISPEQGVAVVDEKLAGELINLPYEAWAIFEKRVPREQIVLTENMKQFLGGPVSRVLTKYGLGKIAKDEIVIITALSAHTFVVISALRKAAPKDQEIPEDKK